MCQITLLMTGIRTNQRFVPSVFASCLKLKLYSISQIMSQEVVIVNEDVTHQ